MNKNLNQEAAAYLKAHEEYHGLMEKLKEKYIKSGKLSGRITVENLSEKEAILLGAIDKSLYMNKGGSLLVKKLVALISSGKFEDIDLLKVLNLYYNKELVSRKTIKENKQKEKEAYFNALEKLLQGKSTVDWFCRALEEKKYGYSLLLKLYTTSPKQLKRDILFLDRALIYIESNPIGAMPLPAFSSLITRNSHYFDLGSTGGKLLINALCFLSDIPLVKSAEETSMLLMSYGILKDEISNQVMTYGLIVTDENGKELPGYAWFRDHGEPLALTAYNVKSLTKVEGQNHKVFVFENPAVFYDLVIQYQEKEVKPSLICTSGQPTLSALTLLDHLANSDTMIYYSGDFDPEGLQMADNLKKRYKDCLKFLEMTVEHYLKIKSEVSITSRLIKLDRISSEELLPLVLALRHHKKAGYQELLMKSYHIQIEKEFKSAYEED